MTGNVRLFVAADAPERHRRAIAAALEPWRARLSTARWTDPAAQHLTLKFLGSTPAEEVEGVAEAAARAASDCSRGAVRLAGFGAFPTKNRMRVLWVGVDDPDGVLTALAAALDVVLAPLGFEPERRAYHPHLTLARFKSPARLPDGLPESVPAGLPAFDVSDIVLYRSHLSPTGARYEPLVSLPVGG